MLISLEKKYDWNAVRKGLKLFHPSKSGSHNAFNEQPTDVDVERYDANNM